MKEIKIALTLTTHVEVFTVTSAGGFNVILCINDGGYYCNT